MACPLDVKVAIINAAFKKIESFIEDRNTYEIISKDTIRINNKRHNPNTKINSEDFQKQQAINVAKELTSRISKEFNGYVRGYIRQPSPYDPVLVTFGVHDAYIENEYKKYLNSNLFNLDDDLIAYTKSNKETQKKLMEFLKQIGVDVKILSKPEIKELTGVANVSGIANMVRKIIYLVEGREDVAMTEEAAHMAIEILEQTNPKLFEQMYNSITRYKMFEKVRNSRRYSEMYRNSNGGLDIRKIKKEAMGKILAEYLIKDAQGSSEAEDLIHDSAELKQEFKNWIEKIINFFKELFSKAVINPYELVASDIMAGAFIGNADIINSDGQYFHVEENTTQNNIVNNVLAESKVTLKVITATENKYVRNGVDVKNRVTDLAKKYYSKIFKAKEVDKDESRTAFDELRAAKGVAGHQDIENIVNLFIDENGYLITDDAGLLSPKERTKPIALKNEKMYKVLYDNIAARLQKYHTEHPGTRFLLETVIYDPKKDEAGTIDFMAVLPDGRVDILDWKFMNINVKKTKDVPWYKQAAFKIQINEYKRILKEYYGVKEFRETMAIPIRMGFMYDDLEDRFIMDAVVVGKINLNEEERNYLVPVATEDQSSGNTDIDKLIKKLRDLYVKISDTPVSEGRKDIKKEQLNKLFHTIRQLQMKQNFKPFFNYVNVIGLQVEDVLNKYNERFKDVNATEPNNIELNFFAKTIMEIHDKLIPFQKIGIELFNVSEEEDFRKQLAQSSQLAILAKNKIDNLIGEFGNKFLGERFNIIGLALAEKEYKGLAAIFRPISKGGTTATTSLYKLTEPIFNKIEIQKNLQVKQYAEYVEAYKQWATQKGLSTEKMFDILFRKDKKGRFVNKLVARVNQAFYKEFKENADKNNGKWFMDNIDLEAYQKEAELRRQAELIIAEEFIFDTDPKVNKAERNKKKKQIEAKYDISTPKSTGWGNPLMMQFATENWYTNEYKEILKNEPVKNFYNYILNLNEQAAELGILQRSVKNTFLPFVSTNGLIEKLTFGKNVKLGKNFINSITVAENDYGYGRRDPVTGKLVYDIYTRYTNDFSEEKLEEDGTEYRDYNEVSKNLFKTIQLFQEEVIKYSGLREVTDSVKLLLQLEESKNSLQTNEKGEIIFSEEGVPQELENNEKNYNLLLQHVMSRVYGITTDESELDLNLGKVPESIVSTSRKINDYLGYELFPTNIGNRQISVPKILNTLNHYFSSKVLSLNFGIFLSNLVGGKMQKMINSGTYYTKQDSIKSELFVTSALVNHPYKEVLTALIKTLHPFAEDRSKHRTNKVTASKLSDISFLTDIMLAPHKYGTMYVEMPHIVAMLENAVIIDGKVVNARTYVRAKYKNRSKVSPSELKEINSKIEKEVAQLKKENGLLAKTKLENDKLTIEGVDILDESILNYRSLIKNLSKDFLGTLESSDLNLANRKLIYKSFLVFKNWIPPLLDKRIGELRYVPGTDSYEVGRARMVGKLVWQNGIRSAKMLKDILENNEKGVEYIAKLLEEKKEKYKQKHGRNLDITEEEFMDIVKDAIRSQMADVMFFLLLGISVIGLHQMIPDDMDPEERGQWNFAQRLGNKLFDEMAFYYNPMAFVDIMNGSVFPGLGVVNDVYNFSNAVAKEMYGLSTGDDKMTENAHPLKYALKFSPMANNLSLYTAVVSPDFAKEMGIEITKNPRK